MTVGWAILGIGGHADGRMAPAIGRAENARLAAVYSRDQGRANAFAAKHGATNSYSSLDTLLADPDVQAVYIGSPNGVHASQAIACARAGKHVLVDKPMATTVEDCQGMIDAARKHGVLLSVGFNQRYQPAHVDIRHRFENGSLGSAALVKVEVASRQGGRPKAWMADPENAGSGSLMSLGSHALDLLGWLTGQSISEVSALAEFTGQGVDEIAVVAIRLSGGAFAVMDCSYRLPWPQNDLTIHASGGLVKATGTIIYDIGGRIELHSRDTTMVHEYRPPHAGHDLFTAEIDELSRIIKEGGTPRSTGEDGLVGVRLIAAIRESARERRAVTIGG